MRVVLQHLTRWLAREATGHLSDHQLLELYRTRRDERAFAALVTRYGPLVLGVCRRALGHDHDAEDAFQATFLVLARRASDVRRGASLGNWLHGVALRLAQQARRMATRRQRREGEFVARAVAMDEPHCPEALQALDEELGRLPEPLRAPLVLCYLAGQTQQQAADQLGLSFGTLRRRLEQGRERLRNRLIRRGLAPAALLAATADAFASSLPKTLAAAAVRAALGGAVSSGVMTLMEKGLRTMFLTRMKVGLAVAALAVCLGGGLVAHQTLTAQQPTLEKPNNPFSNNYAGGNRNSALPAASSDIDRRLADLEKKLAGALDEVKAIRQALKTTKGDMMTISLRHASALKATEVVRAAFPDGQFRVTWDDSTNTVFVQGGTAAELQAVKRLLEALDSDKSAEGGNPLNKPR